MSVAHAGVVARLATLAKLGATEGGIDRALFTSTEFAARAQFAAWAREAGFALVQDRAGNLFARREGHRAGAALLIGSHLDTVRDGGAYDGAYGVVAGLCALEQIAASEGATDLPIEIVAWAGEEGSRFPLGCIGSGVYAGLNSLEEAEAVRDADGVSFAAARDGATGLLPDVEVRADFPQPRAYLEIHVEQGPILERAGERLGVVTAIAGARRFALRIAGEAGHAGTVPMAMRHDALCAASEIVLAVERAALEIGDCVATVGALAVEPNQTNIVPGAVALRVDARSVHDARVDAIEKALRAACERARTARGTNYDLQQLERRDAVAMNEGLRAALHASIAAAGLRALDLPSGAGHDAMCLGRVVPAAMLFVPSAGGRSHVGSEHTEPADLELGVEVLARAIAELDRVTAV